MADLSITAANVQKGAGATVVNGTAGTTITAGQAIFLDATDANKAKLSDADGATASVKQVTGIALHSSLNNQPIAYQTGGEINVGATLVAGMVYVLSDTPGGIMPITDLDAGDRVFIVGYAKNTNTLKLMLTDTTAEFA